MKLPLRDSCLLGDILRGDNVANVAVMLMPSGLAIDKNRYSGGFWTIGTAVSSIANDAIINNPVLKTK